jgi:uncharacterized damage-inducible protein DinB
MAIINSFLAELDQEARATQKVLERVPAEQFSWQPHAKSSTLGKLAWHIATVPKGVQIMVRDGVLDVTKPRPQPPLPDHTAAIVEEYQRNLAETRTFLASLTDEQLHEPFTMMAGERTLLTMPKIAVVRTILMNHTYHHRGQLTVYLRMLDVPVPAVYGNSADEPF